MKKLLTTLMMTVALTGGHAAPAQGDYKELTDILGRDAQIRFVTPTGVLTGFIFGEGDNDFTAFVYQDGQMKLLPPPERAVSSLGFAVSDDGRVVAGTAGMQNLIDGINRSPIRSLAIWETGREPFFADTYELYQPAVRGITPDGSVAAAMGALTSVLLCPPGAGQGDPRCSESISDLYVENGRPRQLNSGRLGRMSSNGRRLLDTNRLIDSDGKFIREYDFLAALEVSESQGRTHEKITADNLRKKKYTHYFEMEALNQDASVAAGTLTAKRNIPASWSEHYFVRWRADGSLDIIDLGEKRYFVESMSDDGRRVLLHHGYYYYVWTDEHGLLPITDYLRNLGVKFDYEVVASSAFTAMSRDGQCFAGNNRDKDRSFIICAER